MEIHANHSCSQRACSHSGNVGRFVLPFLLCHRVRSMTCFGQWKNIDWSLVLCGERDSVWFLPSLFPAAEVTGACDAVRVHNPTIIRVSLTKVLNNQSKQKANLSDKACERWKIIAIETLVIIYWMYQCVHCSQKKTDLKP